MQTKISFHNVDHSDALQNFIMRKSKKLSSHIWSGEGFSWTIEKEAKAIKPTLKLKLVNGVKPISSLSKNPFKAVNEVLIKAQKVIKKSHNKLVK